MTVVHIVLFQFRADVSTAQIETTVQELKQLKNLSCVKGNHLLVGGPSITDPIGRSKGFQYSLLSYHQDRKALEEYLANPEHQRIAKTYIIPLGENLCRFDFEVAEEDEHMCNFDSMVR